MLRILLLALTVAMVTPWNPFDSFDCYDQCGRQGGECAFCEAFYNKGTAYCCRKGYDDPGCYGDLNGCNDNHCCRRSDCYDSCGRKGGMCSACGTGMACCREGYSNDPFACGYGLKGCHGYHCCAKPATMDEVCGSEIDDKWVLVSMDYDIPVGSIYTKPPKMAGRQIVDNLDGSLPRTITFVATETFTERQSFTHSAGVSITVGTTFKVGVPVIAEGEISTEVSTSYEFTYGEEWTKENQNTVTYPCNSPPAKYTICKVLYEEYEMDVPYTAKFKLREHPNDCVRTTKGTFRKVSAFSMTMEIDEYDYIPEDASE